MKKKIKISNDSGNKKTDQKKTARVDSIGLKNISSRKQSIDIDNVKAEIAFVNHNLPSEEEVKEIVREEIHEAKEEEIEESLSEIYHDKEGNMIDVKHMYIKKKRGFLFYIITTFLVFTFIYGVYLAYGKYNYLLGGLNVENVTLEIAGERQVIAGEEFFYSINYSNNERVSLKDVEINVVFPNGFLVIEGVPLPTISPSSQNGFWKIDSLGPGETGHIEVKGKIIAPEGNSGFVFADMNYRSEKYTTVFKKSTSFETIVSSIGIDFSFDNFSSVLVGEESVIKIGYRTKENIYLNNFRVSMNSLENLVFLVKTKEDKPGIWQANGIKLEEQFIEAKFKFKEKINPSEEISLRFEYVENGQFYTFLVKNINIEVMKSTLNLNLILNGSRSDQGIDFGQTMNYSIVYANKGEVAMKNLVIMGVMDRGLINWGTIRAGNIGKISNNTITWTKDEIPGLAVLESGQEGTIDFTVQIINQDEITDKKINQIKSFAQFNIGGFASTTEEEAKQEEADNKDTRSNIIISKLNSDVKLTESVLYFNEDNIAVGSGPLPPKVGQATTYKVYWNLNNTLHELNNLIIETILPEYVAWSGNETVTVGSMRYEPETRKVIWDIGRLPVSDYKVVGNFSISIIPTEEYFDKIMVLTSGTIVKAIDTETSSEINKTIKPKTTQLESDEIAKDLNSDGRVSR